MKLGSRHRIITLATYAAPVNIMTVVLDMLPPPSLLVLSTQNVPKVRRISAVFAISGQPPVLLYGVRTAQCKVVISLEPSLDEQI